MLQDWPPRIPQGNFVFNGDVDDDALPPLWYGCSPDLAFNEKYDFYLIISLF